MAQKKKSNLLEDAASVLQHSISSTRPKADTFGLGKTLHTGPFTVPQHDLGPANVTSDDRFPNYFAGVPTAVPPGATPPVGKEEMHHLEKGDNIEQSRGKQPQLTMGHGDNTDPTKPPYPDYSSFANRISNVKQNIHPGQGNVNPPWAHESVTVDELANKLMEMHGKFHFEGKKKHGKHDDKTKGVFDKLKGKFHKEGNEDITEDDVLIMLNELYGIQEEPISTHDALASIVNEIISEVKGDFSTDVNAIFEGETVSDEFKSKASTIFEAAVAAQVKTITEKLASFTETNINEAVEQIKVGLTDKVDEYLNYMVQEWIAENEIAVEKGLKAEIVEGFISGLRDLFLKNHINIPEEKEDLVDELSTRVADLEEQLNNEIQKNMGFKEQITTMQKSDLVNDVCEGLTATEKDKIIKLAEGIAYGDGKEFKTKLNTLRENYFPKNKLVRPDQDNLNTDSLILETEKTNEPVITDPLMRSISDSISRIAKR